MLKPSAAPHLRQTQHPFYQSAGVLLCLAAVTGFSCLCFGWRPFLLVLIGMITAVLLELLCCAFLVRRPTILDGSAAVTGALIGAMMSPITPFWVPAIGAAFAIGVAKMPFGGFGRNVFNPAAAGVAFCAICFPTRLFLYPDPSLNTSLPLWDTSSVITAVSPTAQLSSGGTTSYNWISLISGDIPGPIGSAGILVLLACAVYLFMRHSASPLAFTSYIVVCTLWAALFPRADISAATSISLELCTGLLLFVGVFLLGDPITAPHYSPARIVYGALAAILTMLLRHYGRFECCDFFAVLLVNSFSPLLDRVCWQAVRYFSHIREVLRS
ncbi:MAG: RnfABCDGE type electron transport complex subunit D [Clostridia bacterium]|nr:RnfABCDGE type electron transport complex subunit D [Clostridia bacterium]